MKFWHPLLMPSIYHYMARFPAFLQIFGAAALTLFTCGCAPGTGGGGGGDDYDPLKGADVYLSVEPDSIGVGERALIKIDVQRINPDGVLVVLRFPSESLAYISGTSTFTSDSNTIGINPTFGPSIGKRRTYLTYFLPYFAFADENAGYVELQLRGERREDGALIELDQFLHDPAIPPEREFSIDDTDFSAEDAERIDVIN